MAGRKGRGSICEGNALWNARVGQPPLRRNIIYFIALFVLTSTRTSPGSTHLASPRQASAPSLAPRPSRVATSRFDRTAFLSSAPASVPLLFSLPSSPRLAAALRSSSRLASPSSALKRVNTARARYRHSLDSVAVAVHFFLSPSKNCALARDFDTSQGIVSLLLTGRCAITRDIFIDPGCACSNKYRDARLNNKSPRDTATR